MKANENEAKVVELASLTFSFDDATRKRLEDLKDHTGSKTLAEVARRVFRAGLTTVETQEKIEGGVA